MSRACVIVTGCESDPAKLELDFQIVRLQFCGFLEQRIGLHNLSLVEINGGQLPQRHRIVRGKSKHLAILFLGFVILIGGKIIVGAGEMLLLGLFFLCTPETQAIATRGSTKANCRILGEVVFLI